MSSFDTKSAGSGITDPVTVSHTCSSDAKLLMVTVNTYNSTPVRAGGVPTYNSVSMNDSGEGAVSCFNKSYLEVFFLINPSTGAAFDVSVPNTNLDDLNVTIASFESSGTLSKHASNSAEADSANPSVNVSTTVDNGFMYGACVHDLNSVASVSNGANYTEIYTTDHGADSVFSEYDLDWGSSGSIAVNWTANADDWGLIGVAFEETAVVSDEKLPDKIKIIRSNQIPIPQLQL